MRERVDLSTILKDVVKIHQPLAIAKQIDLRSNIMPNLAGLGDPSQLQRVFTNLLENAIYYNKSGGTVIVNTTQDNRSISVTIQDTGIGIDAADLNKIFDRFWRADTSRTQWEGGSGLGLSIVQAIVTRHRGQIKVSSQKDVGSCFTVQLPIIHHENLVKF
jgi:signal transduction histidine kinase